MVERYKFVGSGVTNSQGVAQLTHDANGNPLATPGYVGSGKGLTQMCASLDSPTAISSGSDLSETYSVIDALLRDGGTSSDPSVSFWNTARGSLNRGTDGTELLINSGESNMMAYFNLTNKDSFIIEFDAIFDCVRGSGGGELQLRTSSWSIIGVAYLADYPKDTWTPIKLQVKNGQLTIWIGNAQLTPTSISNAGMFNFYIGADDNYFKYKNFRYYPI